MAMDMVEQVIINTLKSVDNTFFDDLPSVPDSISELNMNKNYEGLVLLLWRIDPSTRSIIKSTKFPINVTQRFRTASNLVDCLKNIGIRDDIGYQTLLYGQPRELRNIFIGLIEKIPKDVPLKKSEKDPIKQLVRCAFQHSSKRNDSSDKRLHKYFPSIWINGVPFEWGVPSTVSFMGYNGIPKLAISRSDFLLRNRVLICSLLERYSKDCDIELKIDEEVEKIKEVKRKPPLMKKPKCFRNTLHEVAQKSSEIENIPENDSVSAEEIKVKKETKDEEAISSLSKLTEEISVLRTIVLQKAELLKQKERKYNANEISLQNMKEHLFTFDWRLEKLIETPDAIDKIEKYVAESDERMQKLQNRWLEARREKDEELIQARQQSDDAIDFTNTGDKLSEVLKAVEKFKHDLPMKHAQLENLKKETVNADDSLIKRHNYTKCIFEIVANIKKQQVEIEKILRVNQSLEKEIKSLRGKLDRTFTVVEERLYKDVQRDPSMHKAYRLLVKIYDECSLIISTIESIGVLHREIDEMNDLICMQQQNNIDGILEKILTDIVNMKKENAIYRNKLTH